MIKHLKDLLFQNRSERQTVAKNVFWLSFGEITSRLIRAAIIIYAARILGAAEYGVFSYALGLAGFFTIFADIGITGILTREVSKKPEERFSYFAAAFWMKAALLLATAAIVFFAAPYFSKIEAAKILVPFVAFLVIFDGLREFSLSFLRGREKMELQALIVILTNVAITVSGFAILSQFATSKALTFTYVASAGIGALISIVILRKEFAKVVSCFARNLVYPIINSAWPLALLAVLGAFMLNIDIIMLGWWRTAEEIGYYSAAQKIIQVLYVIPAVLASATFPLLSRAAGQKNKERAAEITERLMTVLFLVAVPLTVGGIVLGSSIIKFLYGETYLAAAIAFQILIATAVLVFPGTLMGNLILAHDRQKKLAVYVGIASLTNISFNALLIPSYGIVGASVATVFAQSVGNFFTWRVAKKANDFYVLRHLKKIIAAAIVMGVFGFVLDKLGLNVLANIAASAGVYFGTLYLLKEKILEEISTLFKPVLRK